MKKKFFVSCISPSKQLGAMQLECLEKEVQDKAEDLCPERAQYK